MAHRRLEVLRAVDAVDALRCQLRGELLVQGRLLRGVRITELRAD